MGHNWPIFLGFKGGKGWQHPRNTSNYTLAKHYYSCNPRVIVALISRYVSLGSMCF